MSKIKQFFKNHKKSLIITSLGLGGLLLAKHLLLVYNFDQYDYMLSYGKYYDLDKDLNIIYKHDLINVKMRAKEPEVLKEKTLFEFLDKNDRKIFEITVYKDPNVSDLYDGYNYHLNPKYLHNPRKFDSYLKYFCDGNFNTCYFTFSFLTTEPTYDFLKEVDTYVMDGKRIKFIPKIYEYKENTEEDRKKITYTYNSKKIEICTKYDSFYFRETLRVTTTENGHTQQKVCVKEETPNGCCTIDGDNSNYSDISILHWKGDLNAGHFQEFSIKLK